MRMRGEAVRVGLKQDESRTDASLERAAEKKRAWQRVENMGRKNGPFCI